eukprot:EG_transcript_93
MALARPPRAADASVARTTAADSGPLYCLLCACRCPTLAGQVAHCDPLGLLEAVCGWVCRPKGDGGGWLWADSRRPGDTAASAALALRVFCHVLRAAPAGAPADWEADWPRVGRFLRRPLEANGPSEGLLALTFEAVGLCHALWRSRAQEQPLAAPPRLPLESPPRSAGDGVSEAALGVDTGENGDMYGHETAEAAADPAGAVSEEERPDEALPPQPASTTSAASASPESSVPAMWELLQEVEDTLLQATDAVPLQASVFSHAAVHNVVKLLMSGDAPPEVDPASWRIFRLLSADDPKGMALLVTLTRVSSEKTIQAVLQRREVALPFMDLYAKAPVPSRGHALLAHVLALVPDALPTPTSAVLNAFLKYCNDGLGGLSAGALWALRGYLAGQRQRCNTFHRLKGSVALYALLHACVEPRAALAPHAAALLAPGAALLVTLMESSPTARSWIEAVDVVSPLCSALSAHLAQLDAWQAWDVLQSLLTLRQFHRSGDVNACSKVAETILEKAPAHFWGPDYSAGGRCRHPGSAVLRYCIHFLKPLPSLDAAAKATSPESPGLSSPRGQSRGLFLFKLPARAVLHAQRLRLWLFALRHRSGQQAPLVGRREISSVAANRIGERLRRRAAAEADVKRLLGGRAAAPLVAPNHQDHMWSIVDAQFALLLQTFGVTEALLLGDQEADAPCTHRLQPLLAYMRGAVPPLPPLHTPAQLLAHLKRLEGETVALAPSVFDSSEQTASKRRPTCDPSRRDSDGGSQRRGSDDGDEGGSNSADAEDEEEDCRWKDEDEEEEEKEDEGGEGEGDGDVEGPPWVDSGGPGVPTIRARTAHELQRGVAAMLLRVFQAEVQWQVLVREDGAAAATAAQPPAAEVRDAFRRLYQRLKPLLHRVDQDNTWADLRRYAQREEAAETKRIEGVLTQPLFRSPVAWVQKRLRSRGWGLVAGWLSRMHRASQLLRDIPTEASPDEEAHREALQTIRALVTQLRREIDRVRAAPPPTTDAVAERLLEAVVPAIAQQVTAQGPEAVTVLLGSGGLLAALPEAARAWPQSPPVLVGVCQTFSNLAGLHPPPNLTDPAVGGDFYPTVLEILSHRMAAPHALTVLRKYTNTATFPLLTAAGGLEQLLAYAQRLGVSPALRYAALHLLALGDYSDATLAHRLVGSSGLEVIAQSLVDAPEATQLMLLDIMAVLVQHETLHLTLIESGVVTALASLVKNTPAVGVAVPCLRLLGTFCGASDGDTATLAQHVFARSQGHLAVLEALAAHRTSPEFVQTSCSILRLVAQHTPYRQQLFGAGAVAAALDAMKAVNSNALSLSQALGLLTRLLHGAEEDAVTAHFVRPQGVRLVCTVMQKYAQDKPLQAKACELLALVATPHVAAADAATAGPRAKKPKLGGVALTMALRKNIESAARGDESPGATSPRRAGLREACLTEGVVGHLVAALRADPANLALQVDALQVVRAIATLGSDAHEELTHPQRRNMVTVHITAAMAAHPNSAALIAAAVATLSELAGGSPQSQKDICLTPGCLRTLCSAVQQLCRAAAPAEPQHPEGSPPEAEAAVVPPEPPTPEVVPPAAASTAITEGAAGLSADESSRNPGGGLLSDTERETDDYESDAQNFEPDPDATAAPQIDLPGAGADEPAQSQADATKEEPMAAPSASRPASPAVETAAASVMGSGSLVLTDLDPGNPEGSRPPTAPASPSPNNPVPAADLDDAAAPASPDRVEVAPAAPPPVAPSSPSARTDTAPAPPLLGLARAVCRFFGLLASARGVSGPLSKHPTDCALALLRWFPSDAAIVDGVWRLLACTAGQPAARRLLLRGDTLPTLLRTATVPTATVALAHLLENGPEAAEPAWAAGAVERLVPFFHAKRHNAAPAVYACRALACIAAINEASRQAVLSTVTAPALLRAVEGRAGDQLVSAAAYLCGVLCDDEVAWRALLAEGLPPRLCKSLRRLERKHAGGEWRRRVFEADAEKHPERPAVPHTWQQMIGFALASLMDFAQPLPPELDDDRVVAAVVSTQVSRTLTPEQHATCQKAIAKLQQESRVEPVLFMSAAPQKGPTAERARTRERLRQLRAKVTELRRQEAGRRQQQLEEAEKNKPPPSPPAEPEPPREHVLTPRVFWHCSEPPEFHRPSRLPANPQKVEVTRVTATSAVVRWERPKSSFKLLYMVRVSGDNGRTFSSLPEPIRQRAFKLRHLLPQRLYSVVVTSLPVAEDGEEVAQRKLAKRPQKLIHFWTTPDRPPPDRFTEDFRATERAAKKLP